MSSFLRIPDGVCGWVCVPLSCIQALGGVKMELEDCGFDLLAGYSFHVSCNITSPVLHVMSQRTLVTARVWVKYRISHPKHAKHDFCSGVVVTADPVVAFTNVDVVIGLGAFPRGPGDTHNAYLY